MATEDAAGAAAAIAAARERGQVLKKRTAGTVASQPTQPQARMMNLAQFFTETPSGLQISPVTVCVLSLVFMGSVVFMHICVVLAKTFFK